MPVTAAQHQTSPAVRRRDRQREETRRDLSVAALDLALARGLRNVRVPEIAEVAGVSTRTFNNYFSSKEAAIVWPARVRTARMAADLLSRPDDEALGDALIATVIGRYGGPEQQGVPRGWLRRFRSLVVSEPGLHGEYLKATSDGEQALAEAIAHRGGASLNDLGCRVLAAMVLGAERAAVMHWIAGGEQRGALIDDVRAAVQQALAGVPR
jgi:AcrR family transcriptional regulator